MAKLVCVCVYEKVFNAKMKQQIFAKYSIDRKTENERKKNRTNELKINV